MRPSLDPEGVKILLKRLSHHELLPDDHPLLNFWLVREALAKPEQLSGPYAVQQTIHQLVRDFFWGVFGQNRDNDPTPMATFLGDLSGPENSYLQACSLIYYRYMRPDLDWRFNELAPQVGVTPRTLNRWENEGFVYLTDDLIKREIAARKLALERLWYSQIPYGPEQPLYDRQLLLERAIEAMGYNAVLVTGEPGIGKTAFSSAIAHQLLSKAEVFHWVILTGQSSLVSQLAEHFDLPQEPVDEHVRLYLTSRRALVIVEGVQSAHLDESSQALLRRYPILCTANQFIHNWPGVIFTLSPLDENAAFAFYQDIRGSLPDESFSAAFAASRGVPGALQEFVTLRHFMPDDLAYNNLASQQYFQQIWDSLPQTACDLWRLLAYGGSAGLISAFLMKLLPNADSMLHDMASRHVVMPYGSEDAYALTSGAMMFIHNQPDDTLADLLHGFEAQTAGDARQIMLLVENGLLKNLPDALQRPILTMLAEAIAPFGLWKRWASLFPTIEEALEPLPYWQQWLTLEKLRLLRWDGQLAASRQGLLTLIRAAGQSGHFDLYARGLLEIGLCAFYQNQPEVALEAVEDAADALARLNLPRTQALAKRLMARLWLSQNPARALETLYPLIDHDPAAAELASSAALALDDSGAALQYARTAVRLTEAGSAQEGRALCAVANALRSSGTLRAALDVQHTAVNVLQISADMVGLARALNNLGVLYHDDGDEKRARDAWEEAQALLSPLQDSQALRTVRANLRSISPHMI